MTTNSKETTMTINISVRKDGHGRVSNVAREEQTNKWVATTPTYSAMVTLLRTYFPHCTIVRIK
jgi:hypothetical protein